MEEMIEGLMQKTGISRAQADQVIEFLKQNAVKLPEWLGQSDLGKGLLDALPGGLSGLLGRQK